MIQNPKKKVFVAMSGGVDSSVVAGLMKEAGHEVVGLTMCFSITHPDSKRPSCCGVEGIQDAQRAAQILGIPHYVLDFAEDIRHQIIDNFVSEYLSGRTPNPCVRCNQHLKFGSLFKKAIGLGAEIVATGHYAKVELNPKTGSFELRKGLDQRKDQAYFLYSMPRETLSRVWMPIGGMTKQEVREHARRFKLNTAEKPESQDICFVPASGYKKFLEDRVGADKMVPGDFLDESGKVVGRHKGIAYYTIGQRDQLGIALGHPVYVTKIDAAKNTVHVGRLDQLYSAGLLASHMNYLSLTSPLVRREVDACVRYNCQPVKAFLTSLENGWARLEFAAPQKSVTPGQSVVLFEGDTVLAGGIIEQPLAAPEKEIPREILSTQDFKNQPGASVKMS